MKFLTVVSTLLLAGTTLAAPGTALRRDRALNRRAGRKGNPLLRADISEDLATNVTNDASSTNWAGAVLIGSGYTSVTGTFTVPTPSTTGSGSVSPGNSRPNLSTLKSYIAEPPLIQRAENLLIVWSGMGWDRRRHLSNRNSANWH